MNRVEQLFRATRARSGSALLPFMTAGLPDPSRSVAVFEAMAAAGADGFEVGIPYADPLMDGPVIQRGSDQALAAGTTIETALEVIGSVATMGKPVLAMTYANPVFRRGVDWFCQRLAEVGADGIIVPDLPVEESASLRAAAARHGIGVVQFVAPTSDEERVAATIAVEPLFVYAVAEMGVTGERSEGSGRLGPLIDRIRAVSSVPVVCGVGISTPEQAAAAAALGADGVIVGSALVRRILEAPDFDQGREAVSAAVAALAAALSG